MDYGNGTGALPFTGGGIATSGGLLFDHLGMLILGIVLIALGGAVLLVRYGFRSGLNPDD